MTRLRYGEQLPMNADRTCLAPAVVTPDGDERKQGHKMIRRTLPTSVPVVCSSSREVAGPSYRADLPPSGSLGAPGL